MPDMTTTTDLALRISIVAEVDNEGEHCTYCSLEGQVIQAQAYITLGEGRSQSMIECCLACLIPTLDSTPYIDRFSAPITVEVARAATARPF